MITLITCHHLKPCWATWAGGLVTKYIVIWHTQHHKAVTVNFNINFTDTSLHLFIVVTFIVSQNKGLLVELHRRHQGRGPT